jgi:Putative manganese efflux pump
MVVAKLAALILPHGLDTFAVPRHSERSAFCPCAGCGSRSCSAPSRPGCRSSDSHSELRSEAAADYVAIGVRLAFGLYRLLSPEGDEEERLVQLTHAHGMRAVLLGVSISLDELAIGFTLGLLRLPAALVIVLIALQAFVVAQLGLRLGNRLSEHLREGAERLAGVALTGLGTWLLAEKLLA